MQRAYAGKVPGWAEPQIENLLKSQVLRLYLSLQDGTEYSSELYPLQFKSLHSYDLKIVLKEPSQTYVRMNIPRRFISQVSFVEGRTVKQIVPH